MEWTFVSWDFVTALISIIMLDILLGGDNAVVIAMAANKLPAALRRKAILIGTGGAVVIRLVMTLIAVWLLTIPYLQVLGGLILLPIAVKLLLPAEHNEQINASDNLMGAIRTIIIADAAMGVDNVLAIAGASHGSFLLVACGFLISIPIIVCGSTVIGRVMDRFPVVLYGGAGLLGWTAGSMIMHDKIVGQLIMQTAGDWTEFVVPAALALFVCCAGYILSKYKKTVSLNLEKLS